MVAPFLLETENGIIDDIEHAAAVAYQAVAERNGYELDDVHHQPECMMVAKLMVSDLLEKGRDAVVDIAVTSKRPILGRDGKRFYPPLTRRRLQHEYPVIRDDGQEVIADATWQQFLDPLQRTADKPSVLVGSRQEVIEQAKNYGITSQHVLNLWDVPDRRKFIR